MLHGACLLANGGHGDLAQLQRGVVHLHIQSHIGISRGDDTLCLIESKARIDNGEGVTRSYREGIVALLIRHGTNEGVFHSHIDQFQRVAIGIPHIAGDLDPIRRKGLYG